MAKLTLTNLSSLTNEESAVTAINTNNDSIEDALENTLSRNGATPNGMVANLDMNSFRVINVGAPVDDNDLVRLQDVRDGIEGPEGPPGPALANGDYGDIVVTGSGATLSLDATITTEIHAATTAIAALGDSSLLDVGTTAGTVRDGDDPRFYKWTVTAKDATGNFALNQNYLYHTSGSAHTWTIQPFATVAIPVGYQIRGNNAPAGGALTITRGVGVALYVNGATSSGGATVAAGGQFTMDCPATNIWTICGPGVS